MRTGLPADSVCPARARSGLLVGSSLRKKTDWEVGGSYRVVVKVVVELVQVGGVLLVPLRITVVVELVLVGGVLLRSAQYQVFTPPLW